MKIISDPIIDHFGSSYKNQGEKVGEFDIIRSISIYAKHSLVSKGDQHTKLTGNLIVVCFDLISYFVDVTRCIWPSV